MTAAAVRFGTAGWSYADWKGVVYPKNPADGFDLVFQGEGEDATVAISQALGGSGTLAGDADVALEVETTADGPTIRFTVTPSFEAAVASYRVEPWGSFDPPGGIDFVDAPPGFEPEVP